jgi:choline-sulfatase
LLAAQGEVQGVKNSGIYERTVQLDYDEEVVFKACRKIHDYARSDDTRPFCLVASMTHPHDPFAVPQKYWDLYDHSDIDRPVFARNGRDGLDANSKRLYDHIGVDAANMSTAEIRTARHAYYAAISFIDDQLGKLIEALETSGQRDNTAIIFLSDHGEALGERGLWFKRSFYDVALSVPMIVSVPGMDQTPFCENNASLVDLLPTLVDLAEPETGLGKITIHRVLDHPNFGGLTSGRRPLQLSA